MKIKLFQIYKDAESNDVIINHIGHLKVKKNRVYTCQVDNCGEKFYTEFNPYRCKNILFNENNERESINKKYIHLNQFIAKYDGLCIIYYNPEEDIYYMIDENNRLFSSFSIESIKESYKVKYEKGNLLS